MPNAVYFNSYRLKKGSSVPDFLLAVEKLVNEIASKHKGYISFALFVDGETWADYSIWETMDDLNAFVAAAEAASASGTNELAEKFYSFLNFNSCRSYHFTVKGSFNFDKDQFTKPNIISFHSYKLNKGVSEADFLLAAEKMNNEFISKQKGWISSKNLCDGKTWADFVIFETQEDLDNFVKACEAYEATKDGFDLMNTSDLRSHTFSVEMNHYLDK